MATDQHNSSPVRRRFAKAWFVVRAVYRYANIATYHLIGAVLKLAIVAYFVFCLVFLSLRYGVLPHIDNYKADIEQMASKALGNPVSIGTLAASWRGLRPHLLLGNVVIHDKYGYQALTLPQVSATVAWSSLIFANLNLHQLEIVSPDMDIQRDEGGNLYVAGILIDTRKSSDSKGMDWVLSQREIVIRDGRLRWNDRKRNAPELALNGVDFVLHNEWLHHQFALRATPPAAFATPLDVRADFVHPLFSHKISDATKWQGELYTDLKNTDLTAWKAYVDYPIELQQGQGAVRAWLDFDHAKVANFTADLTLSNVSARLRSDLPPLELVRVNGRISVREEINRNAQDGTPTFGANGHAIALTDFSLQTKDGLVLPTTTLSESFVPAKNNQPEKMQVNAKLLDLRTLANFVERLPLAAGQRQMLTDFAPRGQLRDFSAQWQGSYPNLSSYSIAGKFSGLSLSAQAPRPARAKSGNVPAQAALPGIPGFDNLTGAIDANDRGGSFNLNSARLNLYLPGYFNEPVMPFERLDMQANWSFQEKDKLLLHVDKMDFVQDGLSASLSGTHLMSLNAQQGRPLGDIDLTGEIAEFDFSKTGRYLPLQTPEPLRKWLTGALESGKAKNVAISIKGDLADFPFHSEHPNDKPKGVFSVAGRIENGRLNYVPGIFSKDGKSPLWPVAEELTGTIRFDRTRMEIHAETGKTNGVDLSNVKAVVPDLSTHDLQLDIEGNAAGALQDFVRYVNASPVDDWIAHFTEDTKASGNAKLELKLQLPLAHLPDAKVQGSLQFSGNDVTLLSGMPMLASTGGKLDFNEKGISLGPIKANFLGAPTVVSGGTQRDGNITIKADGSVSADGIRKAYTAPAIQRLAQHISGSTRYAALISVKKKQRAEVTIESNLQGLGLDFPAPLQKIAGQNLPFKLELAGAASDDAAISRDEIRIALGSAITARYERQKSTEKNSAWRVVRGGVGVNVPAPQPDSGVMANVSLRSLNIDAWNRFVTSIAGTEKSAAAPVGRPPDIAADGLNMVQYVNPEMLAAHATELIVAGKKFDNVVVGASRQKDIWQANIDSNQASGYLTWSQSASGQGLGKVTARLASLIIPKSAASEVTELLEGKNAATQMPGLDIVAENFELFGKRFGHLELQANNIATSSMLREWRIGKLSILNPDGELKASGKWVTKDGESMSSLNFELDIANGGKLLDRFGFPDTLRAGKGKMNGEITWTGLPYSIDIPTLSGQLQLDVKGGQFLKVDPGAAKLLSILSLQSLPRRLTLDFRDVFSEGFAFDVLVGTARIDRGVAKTDSFKMQGVNALVLMDGGADIAKETANLHVVIIPEINAGTASLVVSIINPVVGLGSFLAQLFLRDPLRRAFTFEYQVSGPWKDPVFTKLEKKTDNASGDKGAAAPIANVGKN